MFSPSSKSELSSAESFWFWKQARSLYSLSTAQHPFVCLSSQTHVIAALSATDNQEHQEGTEEDRGECAQGDCHHCLHTSSGGCWSSVAHGYRRAHDRTVNRRMIDGLKPAPSKETTSTINRIYIGTRSEMSTIVQRRGPFSRRWATTVGGGDCHGS